MLKKWYFRNFGQDLQTTEIINVSRNDLLKKILIVTLEATLDQQEPREAFVYDV